MAAVKRDFVALPEWATSRWFLATVAAVYLCAAAVVAWRMLGQPLIGVDDANIFFVYARNFVHGHGIVYNVGGEHVEGFSSPLYFAICSVAYLCTSSPEMLLLGLNVLFALSASVCVVSVLCDLADCFSLSQELKLLVVGAYLMWVLLDPCYFAWMMVSLMDTAIYSALLTASFAYVMRLLLGRSRFRSWQLCLLIVLTILSRPEGVVWAALTFICCAWLMWRRDLSVAANARVLVAPLSSLIATPLVLAGLRLAYFGYPLPNTYYAKVSASLVSTLGDGWSYLASFIGFYGFAAEVALTVIVAWIAYAFVKGPSREKLVYAGTVIAIFCVAALFVLVLEGGDHFYGYRMYQPVYPLLFVAMAFPLAVLAAGKQGLKYGYVAVMLGGIVLPAYHSWSVFQDSNDGSGNIADIRVSVRMEFNIAANERDNGVRLRQLFQDAMPTIGFGSAGGIAYGYQGTVCDMMGLNNVSMAHAEAIKSGPKGHESFNKEVFYQLAPDLLMPRAAPSGAPLNLIAARNYYVDPGSWDNRIFKGLFNDERFQSTYTFALLMNATHPESVCYGYFNDRYLARVSQNKGVQISVLRN